MLDARALPGPSESSPRIIFQTYSIINTVCSCTVICLFVLPLGDYFIPPAPVNNRPLETSQTDDSQIDDRRGHAGFVCTGDEKMARTIMDPFRPRR